MGSADETNIREARIGRVLNEFLERRNRGEQINERELIDAHPDVANDLQKHLEVLRWMPTLGINTQHQLDAPGIGPGLANVPQRVTTVPDYDLIQFIGAGGFGQVWLARQKLTDVLYAIKLVPCNRLGDRELQAVRLYKQHTGTHPNLVHLEHVGEIPGHYYYVMELADDTRGPGLHVPQGYGPVTLAEHLRRCGTLPDEEAAEVAGQILRGLAHLHAIGLLHRDIKPANILRHLGRWQLCDIGLISAHAFVADRAGTLAYAPPGGVQDRTGDLYSIGLVLHEMLTGRRIDDCTAAPHTAPGVVSCLMSVVHRACHPEPAQRFQSAGQMLSALAACSLKSPAVAESGSTWGSLSIVVMDGKGFPASALEMVLEHAGVRSICHVLDGNGALEHLRRTFVHAIYLNPLVFPSLDKAVEFIKVVRTAWPHVVFVLFLASNDWQWVVPNLPDGWRLRLRHYFRVDRGAGLECFGHEVAASLDGIRYDIQHAGGGGP